MPTLELRCRALRPNSRSPRARMIREAPSMKAVLLQGAHSCSIYGVKARAAASTHKKVIVTFFNGETLHGYFNPLRLPNDPLDVLTTTGEHREIAVKEIRAVYFVRDFTEDYEPERKAF